ncbi:MAG: hypothetical protein A3I29_04065 [Candidatus Magasanikbacteria bacterium RIFCSPLOWO2_02_FULL_44_11]|uniref:Sugar 3,4-ketoisomerase QdtA cupin domain-containing protein n=2 Tax=Candidatus Magasanikiibacteriota TaxID=1752731 RepID=A0A1F6N9N4_9BACT|nr:MAG: hypothetical protein A3D53_02920 [Candidatus Magasanikbacteria bacterium RIFCSPHIGHO2_02_FULL_45_10]OGH80589.1 MAG: hypothetical protein A3I29_04065 [Candidatus Magasanikbacteria bacterium RIFCSPLOWO2_02_FULL_44_11]
MHITKNIMPEFVDNRGSITKILDDGKTAPRSILYIVSKKGSVRANHYHKEDSHYVYLLSGKMEYFEAPVKDGIPDQSKRESVVLASGDMVYSPPMLAHAMRFLEDTTWVVLAMNSRSQDHYEADTVRVKLI